MTRPQPTEQALPAFQSIQEEADFWDTHSTTEFENHWQPVEIDVARPIGRTSFVTVELDEVAFTQLRTAAKRLGVSADDLAKMWVIERLAGADSPATD